MKKTKARIEMVETSIECGTNKMSTRQRAAKIKLESFYKKKQGSEGSMTLGHLKNTVESWKAGRSM